MIQANELRIGNWLHKKFTIDFIDGEGDPISYEEDEWEQVESISYDHLLKDLLPDSYYINGRERKNFHPIPLSPELLEKCGFEKHENSNEYWNFWVLNSGWNISEWVNEKPLAGFEVKGVLYWGDSYMEIKYLHELQNFYFAHTKNELTVNI